MEEDLDYPTPSLAGGWWGKYEGSDMGYFFGFFFSFFLVRFFWGWFLSSLYASLRMLDDNSIAER